jgi:large subunit ribosomal protein L15
MNMNLPKIKTNKKRLGRGYGSGKGGHTVGRGQKGQKTRNKIGILFEGVKTKKSLVKRLPFLRGRDKLLPQVKPYVLDISRLNTLPKEVRSIDVKVLVDSGLVDKDAFDRGVKILGRSKVERSFVVEIPVSKSARERIIEAGGEVKYADK